MATCWAFKEWAAVCEAIAAGRQTILLRKGGIHERNGSFVAEHRSFWLFPTRFHQDAEQLSPAGQEFLRRARQRLPAEGVVRFSEHVEVTDVVQIERENVLPSLRPYHVYSDRVLSERFHYKRIGLTLMVVRASIAETPITLVDSPHFGGCRSWVDLPGEVDALPTRRVLDDICFERLRSEILRVASPIASV